MTNLPNALTFEGTDLTIIDHAGTPWIAAADIARALGYSDHRKVSHLYNRRADEFTPGMTEVVTLPKVSTPKTKGMKDETRIFSPRGCHLLAMFARTDRAKAFRAWVLDVLEGVGQPQLSGNALQLPAPARRPDDPLPARTASRGDTVRRRGAAVEGCAKADDPLVDGGP